VKNFVIVDTVHLSINGGEIRDFHNAFDFAGLRLDLEQFKVVYQFTPYRNEHSNIVEIHFSDVGYFEFTENPFTETPTEVEEFGYKDIGDDDMDWICDEMNYKPGMHFIVRLRNDSCLRIGAGNMFATVRSAKPSA